MDSVARVNKVAKSKSGRNDEDLKGENRLLRKQLKLAQKETGQLRKRLAKYENIVDNYVTESEPDYSNVPVFDNYCVHCSKGIKQEVDLGARLLVSCSVCDYREVIKK